MESIAKQPATEIKHTDGNILLENKTVAAYNEVKALPDMPCSVPGSSAAQVKAHDITAGSTSSTSSEVETTGAYVQPEPNLFPVCSPNSARSAGDYVRRESGLLMDQVQSFNNIGKSESKCKVIKMKIELNQNLLNTEPSKNLLRSRRKNPQIIDHSPQEVAT